MSHQQLESSSRVPFLRIGAFKIEGIRYRRHWMVFATTSDQYRSGFSASGTVVLIFQFHFPQERLACHNVSLDRGQHRDFLGTSPWKIRDNTSHGVDGGNLRNRGHRVQFISRLISQSILLAAEIPTSGVGDSKRLRGRAHLVPPRCPTPNRCPLRRPGCRDHRPTTTPYCYRSRRRTCQRPWSRSFDSSFA